MQKHNDLFELKFNLIKLKSWGNGVSVNLLSGGMPLVHRNPYPILYHDQLDFAALFCNEHLKTLFILLLQLNKTRSISLVVQEQSNIGCVHIYDVTYSLKLRDIISNCSQWFWWILWSHYAVNYMCCYLAVSRFFVCYFWFSSRSMLGFCFTYLYLLTSHTCEKNCHILIDCLFVNLRLTYGPRLLRSVLF